MVPKLKEKINTEEVKACIKDVNNMIIPKGLCVLEKNRFIFLKDSNLIARNFNKIFKTKIINNAKLIQAIMPLKINIKITYL